MIIDVLTLFPEMIKPILEDSIIKRAIDGQKVTINLIDFRKFSKDKHHRVDDYAFSGGAGMVLQVEPIDLAIKSIKNYQQAKKILLSPQGKTYNQKKAYELAKEPHLILVCGHYEGFDERIREYLVDEEISIGDYVLTGGEIAAMVLIDSLSRLQEGVLNKKESYLTDSFNNGVLEFPQYTRPRDYLGMQVPEVLFSGHEANIKKYKAYESIKKTYLNRPDLCNDFNDEQREILEKVKEDLKIIDK